MKQECKNLRTFLFKEKAFWTFSGNIDEIIEFFDMNLNELSSDINKQSNIKKGFTDFFIKLRETKEILLTKEQVERLQKLVSKFVEHFAVSSLPYRRALLNILGEKP